MKSYYVCGCVKVTSVGKASGSAHVKTKSFGRAVVAVDAKSARDMVMDGVKRKCEKENNIYVVTEVKFLDIDVYERVMSFQAFEEVSA